MDSIQKQTKLKVITRDLYADNLKSFLMILVIFGHFLQIYQGSSVMSGMKNCIYSFHMPLFIFLSGYFSKNITCQRQRDIDCILYPFFIFQILNIIYTKFVPAQPLKENIFYPYHQNWYLLALFWWRLITPYFRYIKKKFVISFSFVLSLSIGFFPEFNMFLGLYKTIYFLPFFVIGYYCEELGVLRDRLEKVQVWLIVLFVAIMSSILLATSFDNDLAGYIKYGFIANDGYGCNLGKFAVRGMALLVSILLCFIFLSIFDLLCKLIKTRWLHNVGGGTMLTFLSHEFIMIPLLSLYSKTGIICPILCLITSILIWWITSRESVVAFFLPLLDLSVLCRKCHIPFYREVK